MGHTKSGIKARAPLKQEVNYNENYVLTEIFPVKLLEVT